MGFFQPAGSFSKFYIGMSYQQVYKQTIVWVRTRLQFGLNSSSAHEAVLLDDGNLVLRDEYGSVLRQSFDHPGVTWLPGANIRYDKRTKKSTQRLTSWKSSEDPSPGLFSLELDESTAYKVLWNGSAQYWSSESYFSYSTYNHTNISRLFIDISAQIKLSSCLGNSAKSMLTVAPMGFAMTSLNLFANALLMGLIWSEEHVLNLQQLEEDSREGSKFYLSLSASDMPSGSSGNSNTAMIFGAVLGSLGVILAFEFHGNVFSSCKLDLTTDVENHHCLLMDTINF
ncbi:hypothetical protein HID58_024057 [Brassica napus]|uniref:Bulb-type lectin domain-containing protein n=1 Tax=Brassica napus TaxID=3708 RepID=A0ABQ8D3W3_BRANA|nr:hypothetical protein HID58_024057 [Brassica napus]